MSSTSKKHSSRRGKARSLRKRMRRLSDRPIWIRGIDHRIDPHYPEVPNKCVIWSNRILQASDICWDWKHNICVEFKNGARFTIIKPDDIDSEEYFTKERQGTIAWHAKQRGVDTKEIVASCQFQTNQIRRLCSCCCSKQQRSNGLSKNYDLRFNAKNNNTNFQKSKRKSIF